MLWTLMIYWLFHMILKESYLRHPDAGGLHALQ